MTLCNIKNYSIGQVDKAKLSALIPVRVVWVKQDKYKVSVAWSVMNGKDRITDTEFPILWSLHNVCKK